MNGPQTVNEKLDLNVVFIYRSVCFPDPRIKNTVEAFGLEEDEATKEIVSLGAFRVFPKEVWEEVFDDYKESPMYHLQRIRSQLDRFIANHTYPFFSGAVQALPVKNLPMFMETIEGLEAKFAKQKQIYVDNLNDLLNASEKFWSMKGPKIFQIKSDELSDIIRSRFDSLDQFKKKFKLEIIAMRIESIETGEVEIQDKVALDEVRTARDRLVEKSQDEIDSKKDQFQMEIVLDLRARAITAVKHFMDKLQDGKITKTNINSLNKAIKDISDMNFMEDRKLSDILGAIKETIDAIDTKEINEDSFGIKELKKKMHKWISELEELSEENPEAVVARFLSGMTDEEREQEETLVQETMELMATPAEEVTEALIDQALDVMRNTQRCSTSAFQRRLKISFTTASKLMNILEERGIIGPSKNAQPRDILIDLTTEVEELEEDPF